MYSKQRIYTTFVVLLSLSLLLFVLAGSNVIVTLEGWVGKIFVPGQRLAYEVFGYPFSFSDASQMQKLREENAILAKQLVEQDALKRENAALHDQFASTLVPTRRLLPASIISARMTLSGLEQPTEIILDKGSDDAVKVGASVIYKDILIGIVTKTTPHASFIEVITNPHIALPVRITKNNALGIIRGQEKSLLLDKVLVSDTVERGDIIVTKGSMDIQGIGVPPDLLVGTVVRVQKKPSALFQTAEVKLLIDMTRLSTVFIVL